MIAGFWKDWARPNCSAIQTTADFSAGSGRVHHLHENGCSTQNPARRGLVEKKQRFRSLFPAGTPTGQPGQPEAAADYLAQKKRPLTPVATLRVRKEHEQYTEQASFPTQSSATAQLTFAAATARIFRYRQETGRQDGPTFRCQANCTVQ